MDGTLGFWHGIVPFRFPLKTYTLLKIHLRQLCTAYTPPHPSAPVSSGITDGRHRQQGLVMSEQMLVLIFNEIQVFTNNSLSFENLWMLTKENCHLPRLNIHTGWGRPSMRIIHKSMDRSILSEGFRNPSHRICPNIIIWYNPPLSVHFFDKTTFVYGLGDYATLRNNFCSQKKSTILAISIFGHCLLLQVHVFLCNATQ